MLAINASIIQSSVFGPTAYVIDASDLKTLELANSLDKYADDTYLRVPASHSHTISGELDNVSAWAAVNNLSLNVNKSCEMIVRRPRLAINDPIIPPTLPGVKRVFELNILGVRMSDRMDFTPHINYVTTSAVQSTYAQRVLRAHGPSGSNLWDVTRATASPTISLGSHQNIGLHTGARANVVLLTYLLTLLSQSSLMPALLGGVIWTLLERPESSLF